MDYKVLITTSGIGQRLGELTKYTNKSLVRIGKKPALSYIIEAYPEDIPLVISVGYFGEQVRDFVRLAYPQRQVEFVEVDKFCGPGSSLGYSMLCAKDKLQCPFIYHACDTIVNGSIPKPDRNWVGGCHGDDVSQYASFKARNSTITSFGYKGAADFDYIHIGLIGVNDYAAFWNKLRDLYEQDQNNEALGDFYALVKMLESGTVFNVVDFYSWIDIGNMAALRKAREKIGDHFDNLDKVDESIFIFDSFVIKFFHNEKHVRDRVARAAVLSGHVPEIEGVTKNFYRYKYVSGDIYSQVVNPTDLRNFLAWAKQNLWHPVEEVDHDTFKKVCHDFYFNKTKERIDKFLQDNMMRDEEHIINGEKVPALSTMLAQIDFDWLTDAKQHRFHGDMVMENIVKTAHGYSLLDWRQNFGGLIKAGDMYYDLAKLNHNLVVNHDLINKNLFTIDVAENGSVTCDVLRRENHVACQKEFNDFVAREGYDARKVEMLTALIWLNMSPLHHHPFNLFLYYFGKLNLWRAINK